LFWLVIQGSIKGLHTMKVTVTVNQEHVRSKVPQGLELHFPASCQTPFLDHALAGKTLSCHGIHSRKHSAQVNTRRLFSSCLHHPPSEIEEVVFTRSRQPDIAPINLGDTVIEQVHAAKLLGVTLSSDLSWNIHVENIVAKCNQRLYLLYHLRRSGVPPADLLTVYKAMIRPVLEYACPAWHSSLPAISTLTWSRSRDVPFGQSSDRSHTRPVTESGLTTAQDRRKELCQGFYQGMKDPQHRPPTPPASPTA